MTCPSLNCAISNKPIEQLQSEFFASRKDLPNSAVYKILLTKEELAFGTQQLADQLNKEYDGQEVCIIALLNGACWFLTDLSRLLNFPVTFHFVRASSYGKKRASSGSVSLDLTHLYHSDFEGKRVLIVDELFDSGRTITVTKQSLASSFSLPIDDIKSCTLMSTCKPTSEPPADYCFYQRFTDLWILGYGLDDQNLYRNYPHVLCYFPPTKDQDDLHQRYLDSRKRIHDAF
ncbi:hypothetical protein P9112_005601 [Eukaryota sp. TZLM1-RC]